jgi:glycosyltransferase involved in cell wall biosynthesis
MTSPSSLSLQPGSAPRLSIIIATWQAARTLERSLRSVLEQNFTDWELLISDGGSTDGTVDLIRKYESHVAWWQSKVDNGIYDAWNHAIDNARGEYVTFLGADDVWHSPSILADAFAAIGRNKFDMVTGRGILVDRRGRAYSEQGAPWHYKKVMRRMTICHPGSLHRRDLFSRYGMFDTSYRISGDYDFILRLPENLRTLHLNMALVDIADAGISRNHRWLTLCERYRAQSNCPRVGRMRAMLNFVDKLWRIPVAQLLGIPN